MTLHIQIPGTLSSTTGLRRVIPTNNNFPSEGLTDLLMFADGSGTTPVNAVSGRPSGIIEVINASSNAYSWLSGGGGVQLEGSQIISLPPSEQSTPWSLVSVGAMVGNSGASPAERIAGILAFKEYASATIRGAAMYMRSGADWSGAPNTNYQLRPASAGVQGTTVDLLPSESLLELDALRIRVMSWNGSTTLSSKIYNRNGILITSATSSTTTAAMFTASSVTLSTLSPCIGISNSTYNGGAQQVEAFARYNRLLIASDVTRIVSASVALAVSRGRVWA